VKMLLLSVKTVMIDLRNFELSHLKKAKEETQFWPFDDFLVWYFHNVFRATRSLVGHENASR